MSQTSEVGENLTAMALNVVKTIFFKKNSKTNQKVA